MPASSRRDSATSTGASGPPVEGPPELTEGRRRQSRAIPGESSRRSSRHQMKSRSGRGRTRERRWECGGSVPKLRLESKNSAGGWLTNGGFCALLLRFEGASPQTEGGAIGLAREPPD